LAPVIGTTAACRAMGLGRATFYRQQRPLLRKPAQPRPKPPRALTAAEQADVLQLLHEARFVDQSPAEVYAKLLDEGTYLCSLRTMYRLLAEHGEVRERRNLLRHPHYAKPELLARQPNELWSWDITKLLGPQKWTYFYLYVLLDVYSRYVVGWLLAERESATLAERLLEDAYSKQGVQPGQLTVHADHGAPMVSKPVAQLLADLGVTKTHSRPHVSNDNPYSEAQFKTLKYQPTFPKRSGCLEDALAFCRRFFPWYNDDHYHTGLGLLTPASVHHGTADEVLRLRHQVLLAAYDKHPERFLDGPPERLSLPAAVWINPPAKEAVESNCPDDLSQTP